MDRIREWIGGLGPTRRYLVWCLTCGCLCVVMFSLPLAITLWAYPQERESWWIALTLCFLFGATIMAPLQIMIDRF